MNDKNSALLKQIKAMPLDEIIRYESAAVMAGRIINVIGVACFLLMFLFPNIIIVIAALATIGILSHMGTGIGNTLFHIREHLQKMR